MSLRRWADPDGDDLVAVARAKPCFDVAKFSSDMGDAMGRLKTVASRLVAAPQACAALVPKAADPYYWTPEWKALRLACFRRDRFTCVVPGCGRVARAADHIVSRKRGGPDDLANLRSLCEVHDNAFRVNYRLDNSIGSSKAWVCRS